MNFLSATSAQGRVLINASFAFIQPLFSALFPFIGCLVHSGSSDPFQSAECGSCALNLGLFEAIATSFVSSMERKFSVLHFHLWTKRHIQINYNGQSSFSSSLSALLAFSMDLFSVLS
jgi:hypothetical protein